MKMSQTMKKILTLILFIFCASLSAQRIVFPGQEILFPHLNDPSFVGVNQDAVAMGMLQVSDYPRKQHSQFVNGQIPLSQNFAFGVDYFKDAVNYYNYATAMGSVSYRTDFTRSASYLRIGLSAGIDSRRQDRFPIDPIPNVAPYVPRINESQLGFTYRLGAHYMWNNLTVGATYNKLPIQSVLVRNSIEDAIGYWIKDGYTASVKYGFEVSETVKLTPIFRYLSYANDPIYEGALLANVGKWASASFSYKNDYSITPAVQFEFLNALQISYSYEMAMGDVDFEDVHSLSIAYKIEGDGPIDSEWVQNAEATNKKIAAIKPKKKKKKKKKKDEPEVIAETAPEVVQDSVNTDPVVIEDVLAEETEEKLEEIEVPKETRREKRLARKMRRDSIAAVQDSIQLSQVEIPETPTIETEEILEEVKPQKETRREKRIARKKQRDSIAAVRDSIKLSQVEISELPEPEKEVTTPKPVVVEEEPEPVKVEPVVVEEEPEPVKVEPVVVEEEPAPVKVEPVVVKEEPEPVKVEPVVVEEKPAPKVVEEQPVVVETPIQKEVDKLALKAGYYIVVGNFDSLAKAEAEKQRLKKLDYYTTIGKRTGDATYYLYVDSDRTKSNGQKNPPIRWVFLLLALFFCSAFL